MYRDSDLRQSLRHHDRSERATSGDSAGHGLSQFAATTPSTWYMLLPWKTLQPTSRMQNLGVSEVRAEQPHISGANKRPLQWERLVQKAWKT